MTKMAKNNLHIICEINLLKHVTAGCWWLTPVILARCWWLTPIILATPEAEIRRIKVQGQPMQTVHEIGIATGK
jgi:hypothetical protein